MKFDDSIKKIAVLLSTYNGENYLEEQLDSLINQDILSNNYYRLKIYIRDDGSSDSTLDCLASYISTHSELFEIIDSKGVNLGPESSFISMLECVDSDYYLFCDQDDIWNHNKISRAIDILKDYDSIPSAYFSDLSLCNEDGELTKSSLWRVWGVYPDVFSSWKNYFCVSLVTGCTLAFNKRCKDLCSVEYRPSLMLHDQWISYLCAKYGKINVDFEPSILYRQHCGNVVGGKSTSILQYIYKLKKYIDNFSELKKMIDKETDISTFNFFYLKFKITIKKLIRKQG